MRSSSTRRTLLISLALATAAASSCNRSADAGVRPKNWRPQTMEHGLKVGDDLKAAALDCGGGSRREIAPERGVQLVTFATSNDCSSCAPHMASLDTLSVRKLLPKNEMTVVWLAGPATTEHTDLLRSTTTRSVCVDARGALWDQYDLQHTPITVLLVNGRVTYMNDRMLSNEVEKAAFLQDVRDRSAPD